MFSRNNPPCEVAHAVVAVTPALAEKWLGHNTHNRNVRQTKVEQYARDMATGRWRFNGDPIRFDVNGALLDGQHRLLAVLRSGATVQALAVYNLAPEAQDTMDIGAARKLGDQLYLSGETNASTLGAILRRLVMYDAGIRSVGGNNSPTHAEMRDYLDANPEVRAAVDVAARAKKYVPCNASLFGTAYHLCARIDREDANRFFVDQLTEGIGLAPRDPARVLLKRLADISDGRGRANSDDILRYVLHAWNAFRDGRPLTKLQAPKGGWNASNWPEPR